MAGVFELKNANGNNYFVLESLPINLTREEELTLPLLLGLLDTEKKMNAVEWLKDALVEEFNFSKKDLDPYPYFVHVQPSLNAQDKLLILAGEIIEYMKKGQAIKFFYEKNLDQEFKQVAPLQIRYYNNRYYFHNLQLQNSTLHYLFLCNFVFPHRYYFSLQNLLYPTYSCIFRIYHKL
jgi:hypothetical protein